MLFSNWNTYRISGNSFRGNYSREETIQRRKLFAEIQYLLFQIGIFSFFQLEYFPFSSIGVFYFFYLGYFPFSDRNIILFLCLNWNVFLLLIGLEYFSSSTKNIYIFYWNIFLHLFECFLSFNWNFSFLFSIQSILFSCLFFYYFIFSW